MKMSKLWFLLAVMGICSCPMFAQVSGSSIVGTVTDSAGAIIPGVKVIVLNTETNQAVDAQTNDVGHFDAKPLRPGTYDVTVEHSGFKKFEAHGLTLRMEQQMLLDIELDIGSVTESVTVVGAASLVNAVTAERDQVIENKAIVQLPLNGRNYLDLAKLAVGTTETFATAWNRPAAYPVSINGGRGESTGFRLEGINNKESFFASPIMIPSVDSVQEFNVKTNNYSAEYGDAIAGIISATIRSGTNEYHGVLFEFLRNDKLETRPFFSPRTPPYRFNQFGATLGGPVWIPKAYKGKDRTFFFVSYEGGRFRNPSERFNRVPTAQERAGDFSGSSVPLLDPLSFDAVTKQKQPFLNNRIPAERIDPISRKFLDYWPQPDFAINARNQNQFVSQGRRENSDQFIAKIDHNISDQLIFSGSMSILNNTVFVPGAFKDLFGRNDINNPRLFSFGLIQVYSPSITNETRVGYTRGRLDQSNTESDQNWHEFFGFDNAAFIDERAYMFPIIGVNTFTGLGSFPSPNYQIDNQLQIFDTVSIVHGKHSIRTGFQFSHRREEMELYFIGSGGNNFNGDFSKVPFADFLLGFPVSRSSDSAIKEAGLAPFLPRQSSYSGFIQDDWRVSSRLTLNFGLRYDALLAPYDENNRVIFGFDEVNAKIVYPADLDFPDSFLAPTGHFVRVDRRRMYPNRPGWGPRFGFAWRPFGSNNTVVRSGYAVFHQQPPWDAFGESFLTAPFRTSISETFDISGLPPARIGQMGVAAYNPAGLVSFRSAEPNFKNAYMQQWNFSIQQQLPGDLLVELGYVGNKGTNLDWFQRLNTPPPGAGALQPRRPYQFMTEGRIGRSSAASSYHGLQMRVEKSYSRGLYLLGTYAWGKALDNVSSSFAATQGDEVHNQLYDNKLSKGRSGEDVRHRLSLSAVYELPFGRNMTGLGRALLNGWQVAGILSLRTGLPITPVVGQVILNNGFRAFPDRMKDGNLPSSERTLERWFDVSAFSVPALYKHGTSGRRVIDAPGFRNLDFSLTRSFPIRESTRLEFRAEAFNAANHPNFGAPNNFIDRPAPGAITSTVNTGRRFQFALKLYY
jgi:hypothetical protein